MTAARLIAIGIIYVACAVAWFILGGTVVSRSGESDQRIASEVARLWGGRHTQVAPSAWVEIPRVVVEELPPNVVGGPLRRVEKTVVDRTAAPASSSRVEVTLDLDQRRKGLLWYDTYGVAFTGEYRFRNPHDVPRRVVVSFVFPSAEGLYDDFAFELNGAPTPPLADLAQGLSAGADLAPGQEAVLRVRYRSRGLDDWTYAFSNSGVAQVRDFQLVMKTDFRSIDFPAGTLSPTERSPLGKGWTLTWRFASLVTGQRIGMDAPNRLNPGPLAARITFFAPVSLLFFITVMVIVGAIRGQSLHPMHYFFVSAAFFAFHLLLAYLVDHVDIHAAFAISAVTSLFLVVSYLRLVAGDRFALAQAGAAQLVFLVLFSYAFFFEGYTGLTVTVGAIVTLYVLMQLTARVRWDDVFGRDGVTLRKA
jgi:inner membrane protein CreD